MFVSVDKRCAQPWSVLGNTDTELIKVAACSALNGTFTKAQGTLWKRGKKAVRTGGGEGVLGNAVFWSWYSSYSHELAAAIGLCAKSVADRTCQHSIMGGGVHRITPPPEQCRQLKVAGGVRIYSML